MELKIVKKPKDKLERFLIIDKESPGRGKEIICENIRKKEIARLFASAPKLLNALKAINDTIYGKGATLGTDEYFKIRHLCCDNIKIAQEEYNDITEKPKKLEFLLTVLKDIRQAIDEIPGVENLINYITEMLDVAIAKAEKEEG